MINQIASKVPDLTPAAWKERDAIKIALEAEDSHSVTAKFG